MAGCSGGAFGGLIELERDEDAFVASGEDPDCLLVTVTHR